MKTAAILLGTVLASGLGAQTLATPTVQQSRTFVQTGALMTRGDDSGWGQLGYGLSYRSFTYFDPAAVQGPYWGLLSAALSRSAGGVSLADTRLVTLGWRGSPFDTEAGKRPGPEIDLSVSPTLGSRIQDGRILGSLYTGVGLTLGVSVPVWEGQSVGLGWEPVFPVTSWGEAPAPNLGYQDFVISWTVKVRTETKNLPWSD